MKQYLRFGLIVMLSASSLMFTGCQGEDGDPGPTGAQGEQGDKGDSGEGGVGFSEATQYGNIVVRYKGTRSDDVAFDQTVNFKFCPPGPEVPFFSSVESASWGENSSGLGFDVRRYNSFMISNSFWGDNGSYVYFNLRKAEVGDESDIYVETVLPIISNDMKYFTLNARGEYLASDVIDEYSFTSATGALKFKFSIVSTGEENPTGHDLEITAEVNVKVLKDQTPK